MATGVVCSVVHLTHPPPVPVLLDGMAVPRPLPARCSPLRKSSGRPRQGAAFRHWSRTPTLPPPSQVRPWALNPEVEEELRESLVVLGPSNVVGGTTGVKSQQRTSAGRALTAPPASMSSSMEVVEDHQPRDDPKTPQSSTLSFKDLVPRSTEDAVTVFPVRPPISAGKSILGRLFTKPALTEDQADQLGYFQHAKPPALPARPHSWFAPNRKSGSRAAGRAIDLSLCVTTQDYLYAPGPVFNQQRAAKSQQLYLQDIVLRPRIFTVNAKRNPDSSLAKNDASDSQWTDITASTKRLKTPHARLGPTAESKDDDFAVVLQGHRKYLHTKPIPDPDQPGVLSEDFGEELAMGSDDSAIDILPRGEDQPDKGGTETPAGQSDTTSTQATFVAPLNSPTDHKDAFPELS